MKAFYSMEELQPYHNRQTHTYEFVEDGQPIDIKICFDLTLKERADIVARNIACVDISCRSITANDIDAGTIVVHALNANNVTSRDIRINALNANSVFGNKAMLLSGSVKSVNVTKLVTRELRVADVYSTDGITGRILPWIEGASEN